MAGKGRCKGCGKVGPVKVVDSHIRTCPDFAELYRHDPSAVLEPAAEYERWLEQDKPAERQREIAASIAQVDEYRAAQAERFTRPPDILADPADVSYPAGNVRYVTDSDAGHSGDREG